MGNFLQKSLVVNSATPKRYKIKELEERRVGNIRYYELNLDILKLTHLIEYIKNIYLHIESAVIYPEDITFRRKDDDVSNSLNGYVVYKTFMDNKGTVSKEPYYTNTRYKEELKPVNNLETIRFIEKSLGNQAINKDYTLMIKVNIINQLSN